ncbi:MAG: hypothetical protein JXR40_11815, partial [Pontiellaceae bacterium]|nr:hypothetical protein [Pontiellaceae bacterium]
PNAEDAPDGPEDQPQNVIAEQSTSEGEQPEERAQTVVDHGVITSAHPPKNPVVGVDIQPQLSASISLPEQAAFGRFYVFNPAAVVQKGTLRLTGPIDQVEWQNNRMLSISSASPLEEKEWSTPLQLASGNACIVDIIGLPNEDGSGGQVRCEWIPSGAGEAVISGTWSFGSAATEKRTAVIDAHELQDNPFYLIPIHHMIQRLDIDEAQTIDFAVKASSPMRIESYDAYTGTLLAVDANGDGDFLDKGDMVSGDANGNNWPDLVFEKEQRLSSLAMYVHPHESSTEDIELTIQIQTEEGWQTDSIDVIKPFVETE